MGGLPVMAKRKELARKRIGKALHKANKKRFEAFYSPLEGVKEVPDVKSKTLQEPNNLDTPS